MFNRDLLIQQNQLLDLIYRTLQSIQDDMVRFAEEAGYLPAPLFYDAHSMVSDVLSHVQSHTQD